MRSCTTWAAPARTDSPSACSPPGAWMATTRTPTSVPRAPALATTSGWGWTGPARTTRTRKVILLVSSHLEAGSLLQPPRPAGHRGQEAGREAHRLRHAALEHGHARRPLAVDLPRLRGRGAAGDRQPPDPHGSYNAAFVERWWNWREYLEENHPDEPVTFEAFERMLANCMRSYTFEFAAAESGVSAETLEAVAEVVAGAGTPGCPPTMLAERGRRQPGRMAGRAGALPAECAPWGDRGARRDLPQRVEQVRPTADPHAIRGTRSTGTSSPGRANTRSA